MTDVLIDRELLDLCYQAVHAMAWMKIEGFTEQRYAKLRAILAQPAQQGEAVEVVGYLDAHDCLWNETTHPDRMIPLMTVGQHQRILAASVPAGCKVVPVELLERAAYLLELGDMDGPTARELRALLEAKDE